MEPHALLLDGTVKFYNFTHYDTADLVRVLEAPARARLAAGVADGTWQCRRTDIHLRYMERPASTKFRVAGVYLHDGLRIAKPQHLTKNPIQALCDTPSELPVDVVQQIMRYAADELAPYPRWDDRARTRRDVDFLAAAPMLGVRINPVVNAKLPKGYMSPQYASKMLERRVYSSIRRSREWQMRVYNAELKFRAACKFMRALGKETAQEDEFGRRFAALREDAIRLDQDIRTFFLSKEA